MNIGDTVAYLDHFTGKPRTGTVSRVADGRVYVRNSWASNSETEVIPITPDDDEASIAKN